MQHTATKLSAPRSPLSTTATATPGRRRWALSLLRCALIGLVLAATGCVSSHEDRDGFSEADLVQSTFAGYTYIPSTTVRMEAFNWATESWDTLASTTASRFGIHYGGATLYSWSFPDFDFTAVPNWGCYWAQQGTCDPDFLNGHARVRFAWPAGDAEYGIDHLVSFRRGGVECIQMRVATYGETLENSVLGCDALAEDTPELNFFARIII